jgi:hypothetical protein
MQKGDSEGIDYMVPKLIEQAEAWTPERVVISSIVPTAEAPIC